MALQGDLKSFALPDVLRLLAGAAKSGHLEVAGPAGTGEVTFCAGTIASAGTDLAPRAVDPSDVVYELLRLEDGSFLFDEGDVDDAGWEADVEATISTALALVDEWSAIEAVVPSMEAWVSLAPELAEAEVLVTAERWQVLAAIGGGGNVHDLAAAFELTDLAASRLVVEVVGAGLAVVRPSHGYQPAQVELDDVVSFEDPIEAPMTDLHDLSAEDRPVVMEDREDALLPEPLPGEGVVYDGVVVAGAVDGYEPGPGASPIDGSNDDFEQFESLASFEAAAAMSEHAGEPGTIDSFGEIGEAASEDTAAIDADDDGAAELEDVPAPAPAGPVDEERDSLLKFLSSVKH